MKKSSCHNRLFKIGLFLLTGLILISLNIPINSIALTQKHDLTQVSEGSVINLSFYSKSLKKDQAVQIYLPEGYDQKSEKRYPVIYFLHGTAQNCYSEGNLFNYFNNLISAKKISPVIIIKPDGSCTPWGDSYFANSAINGNFEDYLVYDLVEFIDSAYRTIPSKDKRAIMGWSAGGSCAMSMALKHSEIYCGAASHSGRMDMNTHALYIPGILSENGGAPVSGFRPDAGPMSRAVYTMAAAYSSNPNNPPFFVDFPFDGNGNFIDSVWNRWLLYDCSTLAGKISKKEKLAIYLDCGIQDETYAYPFNTKFAEVLDQLKLPYQFESYQGGHYDRDSRYPIGLAFLDSVMNKTDNKLEIGSWDYKTSMPTARCFLGACVLNGKIYAIGGATNALTMTSAVEMYDPLTDTWTQKADMPMALCYPNVCALNDKIYVFGGNTAMFSGMVTFSFVYDPDSDKWSQIEDSAHPFGDPCIAVCDGRVYLIGGGKQGMVPVSDVTMYDPSTKTWTKKADLPTPRSMLTACVLNKKIYVFGGTNEKWTSVFFPNAEEYDPVEDKWNIKKEMPLGRWSPGACTLNNRIYVTGGHNGVAASDRVDILNPETNEWTLGTPMQQVRQGHETFVVDGKIYVLGGCCPEKGMPKFLSSTEVYSVGSNPKP
ncbi:MAG: prolyl oligopeptidase family serine peptidase [Prolixibacteraceae bacterium]|nr:prolyl oligopeptidase family serine peptidase [Prolixibacteraceae bacterium]